MSKSISIISIENTIERLELPAFHPRAYPVGERRYWYKSVIDSIADLYDCSAIDVLDYNQLSDRALQAYIHGGL